LRRKQQESNVGTSDSDLFFDICLKISDGAPICRRMKTENWQLSETINSPQNYDILRNMLSFCISFSEMKEKMPNTSLDVFCFCVSAQKLIPLLEDFSNVFFNPLKNTEK
jgi:hypothetical protein